MLSAFALMAAIISFAATPDLRYNKDGKFKIVQLSDLHYIHGVDCSQRAIDCVNSVIDTEKPDLILVTGDLIFGKPGRESWLDVMDVLSSKNVPFGIMFGNHDAEQGLTQAELMELTIPYKNNVSSTTPGVSGVSNYILPVHSSRNDSVATVIYCFDSNTYCWLKDIKGYDYIHRDEIDWYDKASKKFTEANGGKPVESLAFFHIPLPEYKEAASSVGTCLRGTRGEEVCSPHLNSGLFTAMKENDDIIATFVGHDHDNDYATVWDNVLLAFGRFSGCDNVYNNLGTNGARVIELTEGQPVIDSWIRLSDGQKINSIHFDRNDSKAILK